MTAPYLEPSTTEFHHVSVLGPEVLQHLALRPDGQYLDATVGGGGHSQLLLAAMPKSRLVAIDQDTQAIAAACSTLAEYRDRAEFWHGSFSQFDPGDRRFDGILADLGVSSAQFDIAERGFSFRLEAPLDMRMNLQQSLTRPLKLLTTGKKSSWPIFFY
ncbi:MAG: 16S rRNA (cytosine(1402)-N(4))-methyltransferase, partial [Leptolyngbyaceae cyanobacterium RM2_2_21]|nr:16S rRNA (cytosine(1402)-N(4))-methyltransferase [Leptolyngbyaceae cyanobacterium RM2_2_21]